MCEICASMLAAEHDKQPGAELCPKCRRFPLDAEMPLDLSQWDYFAPELQNAPKSARVVTQNFVDSMLEQAVESAEDPLPEESEEEDESEERVRTCYHCYQADSGLAERCPVCGDSYLPPFFRKAHRA
jgi:hypothetical protein